jgi:hypothetical protein
MENSEKSIRQYIRQIIKENINILLETQKGKKIDAQKEKLMSNLNIETGEDVLSKEALMKEVDRAIDFKINKVLQNQYEYPNFYVVKLGSFKIKDNNGTQPIVFSMDGFTKNFTYPYLYIYHDIAIVIKFASRFFDSDATLTKDVEKFLEMNKINLNTMHEKGNKIIFDTKFDTDNIIDLTDYSKIKTPEPKEKELSIAKEKASYRAGAKIKHPRFGRGTIKKTKRHSVDGDGNTWYNVTIDFEGKEKTLRMKQK